MSEQPKGKVKDFHETCKHLGINHEGHELWVTPNGARFLVDKDGKVVVLRYWSQGFRPSSINSRFMDAT